MAEHDYVIDNQTAPNFRADLNNALLAIVSNNSSATEPAVTYANMMWYDTAANILYMMNEGNDAWIRLGTLDQTADTFAAAVALATQAEAEAGTDNTKVMTPLRVAQVVAANGSAGLPIGHGKISSSGSYVIPQGCVATVVAVGAGGGGGGAARSQDSSAGAVANGGGGGSVCVKKIDATAGAVTLTITLGAGGAGGSAINNGGVSGSVGGTTTVTATGISMSAGGGGGGTGAYTTSSTASIFAAAVSGGTASGGDFNITGGSVGVATKTSGHGVYGNGPATPLGSVAASSGVYGGTTLTPVSYCVGVTDSVLTSGRTNAFITTVDSHFTASGVAGGLGCGGGGGAGINKYNTVNGVGAIGGAGTVYIVLEGTS
jgi:hypothetical protein